MLPFFIFAGVSYVLFPFVSLSWFAVFSSDAYVSELADRFGAVAVMVDPDRSTVPISATQIREAPADHLDRLAPAVRAGVEANLLGDA